MFKELSLARGDNLRSVSVWVGVKRLRFCFGKKRSWGDCGEKGFVPWYFGGS